MKTYAVTITATWRDEEPEVTEEEFQAKTKDDAIAQARRFMLKAGHSSKDGPVSFSARVLR